MASTVGGQFKFSNGLLSGVSTPVHLGLKVPGQSVKPGAVKGDFNIEAFVGVTTLPTVLGNGFQQGVIVADTSSTDTPGLSGSGTSQTLVAKRMTLFGGTYKVVDTNTVGGNTARITATIGNQTVVGAAHDTLVGGTGTQRLDGSKGRESIVGGRRTYTVIGGVQDTITGSKHAVSVTAGHITATASVESIQIGKAGSYTITAGNSDTISSHTGTGNATISAGSSDIINLNGNRGSVSVVGKLNDTVTAGRGHETLKGGAGDRIGVGSGAVVGGTLHMSHATTAAGAIAFGSNDTVHSTKYNTVKGSATRDTLVGGTSSANVTVTNFRVGVDSLFYQGESTTRNHEIVATSHTTGGNTTFTLPDGTVMTLIGVSSISASFFKP